MYVEPVSKVEDTCSTTYENILELKALDRCTKVFDRERPLITDKYTEIFDKRTDGWTDATKRIISQLCGR